MAGPAGHPEHPLDAFLTKARDRLEAGGTRTVAIRQLVKKSGATRRGVWVVHEIRQALKQYGIRTEPDFAQGSIDDTVRLVLAPTAPEPPSKPVTHRPGETNEPPAATGGRPVSEPGGLKLTVGVIAFRPDKPDVVGIQRTSDLQHARSVMNRHDYSQLPVLKGERDLAGVVTWESIGAAVFGGGTPTLAKATVRVTPEPGETDLLSLVPKIIEQGFVFVSDETRKVRGIVTTADLSGEFLHLAGPVLQLAEIEGRLRRVIDRRLGSDDLKAYVAPGVHGRSVTGAGDLTLGEIARIFQDPARWEQIGLNAHRQEFVGALEKVRDLRNGIFHFSPDFTDTLTTTAFQNFLRWLRLLTPDISET